ncbi:hypothetical protein KNE206_53500 [Kitasatospora sp. NE20-6]|uniref:hypothetical protein n=1 Tax=Kitasatospora sp. NE20-6 TaxID=2859066 RepID=UPI0034DC1568
MADISFGPGPNGAITARLNPDVPAGAHRILEQNGATRLAAEGEYAFDGPDAVARAAQSAYLLNAGELTMATSGDIPRERRLAVDGADVVFARHPSEGIIAATATNATEALVSGVLKQFGWTYDGSAPDRDIYLPPTDADEREVLVAAARASLVLQGLRLQVSTVGLATPPASADRLAEATEDLALERVNLRTLTDNRDVADLLDTALDPTAGALPNLSALLADIGTFTAQLSPEQGALLGAALDIVRGQATGLADRLQLLQTSLAELGTAVEAPITTTRSIRATAASAVTARGLPAGPIIQAVPAAQALATVPGPAHAVSL